MTFLYYPPTPTAQPVTQLPFKADWFSWEHIAKKRNKYVHFLFSSKTGSGKSTLAQWITSQLKESNETVIAVAPHWQLGDYATADLIVGAGRNYGTSAEPYEEKELKSGEVKITGEPEVTFADVLGGKRVTVCQFMRSLLNEMDRRFQLVGNRYRWVAEGDPFISVILDEYPAYGSMPGVADCLKQLIREARKVGIRLFILAQGSEVKTLGIEGEGSLRENLTFIRLAEWAVDHALAQLHGFKAGSDGWKFWANVVGVFNETDEDGEPVYRAVMVDDVPAIVPDLSAYCGAVVPSEATVPVIAQAARAHTPKPERVAPTPKKVEVTEPTPKKVEVTPGWDWVKQPWLELDMEQQHLLTELLATLAEWQRDGAFDALEPDCYAIAQRIHYWSVYLNRTADHHAIALALHDVKEDNATAATVAQFSGCDERQGEQALKFAKHMKATRQHTPYRKPIEPAPTVQANVEPERAMPTPTTNLNGVESAATEAGISSIITDQITALAKPGKPIQCAYVQSKLNGRGFKGISRDAIREQMRVMAFKGWGSVEAKGAQVFYTAHG